MKLNVTMANACLLPQVAKIFKNSKLQTKPLTCMTAHKHGHFPDRQCRAIRKNDASKSTTCSSDGKFASEFLSGSCQYVKRALCLRNHDILCRPFLGG